MAPVVATSSTSVTRPGAVERSSTLPGRAETALAAVAADLGGGRAGPLQATGELETGPKR